jgi:hypothetical protein
MHRIPPHIPFSILLLLPFPHTFIYHYRLKLPENTTMPLQIQRQLRHRRLPLMPLLARHPPRHLPIKHRPHIVVPAHFHCRACGLTNQEEFAGFEVLPRYKWCVGTSIVGRCCCGGGVSFGNNLLQQRLEGKGE